MPCFALTSPEAGSDAGGIPDFGIVCRGEWEGKPDVLGIRADLGEALHHAGADRDAARASRSASTIPTACSAARKTSASRSR